jgi:hypothetical protein
LVSLYTPRTAQIGLLVNESYEVAYLADLATSTLIIRKFTNETDTGQSKCIKGELL